MPDEQENTHLGKCPQHGRRPHRNVEVCRVSGIRRSRPPAREPLSPDWPAKRLVRSPSSSSRSCREGRQSDRVWAVGAHAHQGAEAGPRGRQQRAGSYWYSIIETALCPDEIRRSERANSTPGGWFGSSGARGIHRALPLLPPRDRPAHTWVTLSLPPGPHPTGRRQRRSRWSSPPTDRPGSPRSVCRRPA